MSAFGQTVPQDAGFTFKTRHLFGQGYTYVHRVTMVVVNCILLTLILALHHVDRPAALPLVADQAELGWQCSRAIRSKSTKCRLRPLRSPFLYASCGGRNGSGTLVRRGKMEITESSAHMPPYWRRKRRRRRATGVARWGLQEQHA